MGEGERMQFLNPGQKPASSKMIKTMQGTHRSVL